MSAPRVWASIVVVLCAALCGLISTGVAFADSLPDGRVYEIVSPPEGFDNEVYQPELPANNAFSSTWTQFPFQASADGDKVAYVGGPTVGGSESSGWKSGNEYLGTRSAEGGWTQTNITPSAPSFFFQAFSSDLSVAFLDGTEPLTPLSPGFGEGVVPNYDVLYETSTGSGEYTPVFTVKPPYRTRSSFSSVNVHFPALFGETHGFRPEGQTIAFAGASTDDSHVLFLANDALTAASEGRPAAEGGSASHYEKENNLYETVGGQLRLVNVLPDGTTHANAVFGGSINTVLGGGVRFSHVISSDGSRIFWTDLTTGHIYVRENGATTVEISPAGKYQTATSDGSTVFFTNGDLYSYDVESAQTSDLTPGEPVERVVGASENGEYVYYVTTGGVLKIWHDGASTAIASSPAAAAEVTPDGHSIVFSSIAENEAQISVYDVDTGLVYCASCSNGGTKGILPITNQGNVYQARWISADGAHVFFDSDEALVPEDTNGVYDVYEWDRPGTSGCTQSGGCVYLLSGGSSTESSYFADASESGNDAFIVTRAKLIGADDNELYDLYDLRVNGFVAPTPPACTGTGCQGVPGAPPIFATPSSATFEGVGNFTASTQVTAGKPKAKQQKQNKKKKGSKKRKKTKAVKGHKRSRAKGGRR